MEWKTIYIKGIETKWEINKDGLIRNRIVGIIKKSKINTKTGYISHCFEIDGKCYYRYLHRLVAESFLENFDPSLTINHKDGDKTNNKIDNLECISLKENIRHGFKTGLFERSQSPVVMYDLMGMLLKRFETITEASEEMKISVSRISACASGKTKHTGYYQWRYEKDAPPSNITAKMTNRKIMVVQKDREGNIINIFNNLKEAYAHINKPDNGYLSRVCGRENNFYAGFFWELIK